MKSAKIGLELTLNSLVCEIFTNLAVKIQKDGIQRVFCMILQIAKDDPLGQQLQDIALLRNRKRASKK